ncbi:MAG: DUF554 domain-containing protein [Anaerolineae bacterium]|nr:DUF554 domain-containing protein [Thermoflexales bacterium]MDW8408094.1 DUF554 domain-containing protein [Anaerolineae bacterium]
MTGTLINVITVLLGTAVGVVLGNRLPQRVRETVLDGLGLSTIAYAVLSLVDAMSQQQNVPAKFIVVLLAALAGGVIGEWVNIDAALHRLGGWLERRFARSADAAGAVRFVRGYVAASLVFCVGPMTILGSIHDGLRGDFTLLSIKSALDGFAALAFAASLGVGVGFSVITIVLFQGGLSLSAGLLQNAFSGPSDPVLAILSAIGALLIIGIGLSLLEIKRVRVANFLPALLIGPLAAVGLRALGVAGF